MAITAAAMQAELGATPNDAQVIQGMASGTKQLWYLKGRLDAPSRRKWVETTAADDAATQAAAALVLLKAY